MNLRSTYTARVDSRAHVYHTRTYCHTLTHTALRTLFTPLRAHYYTAPLPAVTAHILHAYTLLITYTFCALTCFDYRTLHRLITRYLRPRTTLPRYRAAHAYHTYVLALVTFADTFTWLPHGYVTLRTVHRSAVTVGCYSFSYDPVLVPIVLLRYVVPIHLLTTRFVDLRFDFCLISRCDRRLLLPVVVHGEFCTLCGSFRLRFHYGLL